MIIAIDGPAGAGKSTIAKRVAKELEFLYIDTGAMYRALTLKVLEHKIKADDLSAITKLTAQTNINLTNNTDGSLKVLLDGSDVSSQIRHPRITRFVSDIAKIKEVRQQMLVVQRRLGCAADSVLDGRDIGTVVFPDADKKFYLDADFRERVGRRFKELREAGEEIVKEEVSADLANRDKIDSTREFAPLKMAADAIYIDTTKMSIEEVAGEVLRQISLKK